MLLKVGSNRLKMFNPLKRGEGSPEHARPSRQSGMNRVWLVWPRSAPGIPRSRRFAGSRPFRSAKGAWVLLVQRVGGEGVWWWFDWQGRV